METNEPQTEETKADEVFRDTNHDEEVEKTTEEATTKTVDEENEPEKIEEVETETDPDPEPVEDEETGPKPADEGDIRKVVIDKEAEPLYQKKVYIVDLNNIGLKIEGEGELIVDVMAVEGDKAIIRSGDLTTEVPKGFLFSV